MRSGAPRPTTPGRRMFSVASLPPPRPFLVCAFFHKPRPDGDARHPYVARDDLRDVHGYLRRDRCHSGSDRLGRRGPSGEDGIDGACAGEFDAELRGEGEGRPRVRHALDGAPDRRLRLRGRLAFTEETAEVTVPAAETSDVEVAGPG